MPASLRLIVGIIALGFMVAVISLGVQKGQTDRRLEGAARALTGGDPKAGVQAIGRYGCGACHAIPGAPEADGAVGPSLAGVASRPFLAGRLANRPEAMLAWIMTPQSIEPAGGMPDMGVTQEDARDIAAHLYTLK